MTRSWLSALFVVLAVGCVAEAADAHRPNIVYFIIDELGYYEQSHMGHPVMQTPNIDRLAKEGMRFTQMLAGGCVCAPTRSVLMTGQHLGHTTVRINPGGTALRADDVTVAQVLKQAGYQCGGFGKWGLGDRGTTGVPERHGFDTFFGYYHQVHAHTFYPQFLLRNSELVELPGNTDDYHEGHTFSQYRIFEESKKFIRDNRERPFFAYLCWTPPHGQWGMPKDDPSWLLYKDKPWTAGMRSPNDSRMYAAMVNLVDRQVGEIMTLLKELGLEENTIVFFSGDNGAHEYFASKDAPDGLFSPNRDPRTGKRFRGGKGNLYEGGLRVPFIVRWPDRIAAGATNDHLGNFADVLPTLAELAGVEPPKNIDGISIVPTLLGESATGRKQAEHKYLYWETERQRAVREKNWKLVGPPGKYELYDLATDIEEQNDVAAEHPDVVRRLVAYADEAHSPMVLGDFTDKAKSFRATKGVSYVP